MPPIAPIFLNDNVIPQAASAGWEWFIREMLQQRDSAITDGKPTPHVFPIERGAWDILTEYQHRHAKLAISGNDSESALEGKFLTNTARIALILHVVNLIEKGDSLGGCMPIPGNTMESACIVAEWFIDESKRIYAELAGGIEPADREAESIITKIRELGGKATPSQLSRHIKKYNDGSGRKLLDEKLLEMTKQGKLKREFEGTGKEVYLPPQK